MIAFSLCLYSISLLSRLRLPTLQMVWLGWYPSPWDQQEAQWREPHALLHFWLHHFLSIPHQLVDFHGFSLTVFQVFFMCREKKFLIIIFFFFFLKYEFSTSAEHRWIWDWPWWRAEGCWPLSMLIRKENAVYLHIVSDLLSKGAFEPCWGHLWSASPGLGQGSCKTKPFYHPAKPNQRWQIG